MEKNLKLDTEVTEEIYNNLVKYTPQIHCIMEYFRLYRREDISMSRLRELIGLEFLTYEEENIQKIIRRHYSKSYHNVEEFYKDDDKWN